MSDESITHKEDKEDLLYIARKINMEEFAYGEENTYLRESVNSETTVVSDQHELSESETILLDREKHVKESKLGPQIFKDPNIINKTRPFTLMWSYGINPKVRIINLTTAENNEVFFASCHFPIVYNYCKKTMVHFEAHHELITSVSADRTGQWIVSADNGKDGFLNVWDWSKNSTTEKHAPVLSMYAIYKEYGISLVRISPSARYLLTIGPVRDDVYSVDLWLWTLGNDVPEDSFRISNTHGYPVTLCFNPNIEEHIMVVFSKQVFLLVWDAENKKFINKVVPQIMHRSKIGHTTGGCYVDKCHECYVSSSKGCLLQFGNSLYARPFDEGDLDNSKIFRNAVKIADCSVDVCESVDGLIVTGDARGRIYFFNKRLLILYWLCDFNLGPICSLSFNLVPKVKFQELNKYYITPTKEDTIFNCEFLDMVDELEELFQHNLPTDATLNHVPFICRDFFVATAQCNIYAIDVVKNTCTPLFHVSDNYVVAIEAHEESNYIIITYASNRIILINYETNEVVHETFLPKGYDDTSTITYIKYNVESLHLVCGKTNGEIWILEPILLKPKCDPFQITKNKVVKIAFSSFPQQFAYFDSNRTVVIFAYSSKEGKWIYKGKIRPHYDDITDIMFVPSTPGWKLYTIAKDRHIIEYNNDKLHKVDFAIENSERIEQTAIPMCFLYWVSTVNDRRFGYILLSDDRHKLKFLYQNTKIPKSIVLAPAFGCFKRQLIRKMQIIPHFQSKYMAFCTDRHFGLHILPPDGNPYKYVGYLAHPVKLEDFVLSRDGKYIFTFGANDHCIIKWKIETRAVENMKLLGGKELEPFYCLIEGGYHGWLFHEIKDLFYYMQILQQENIDLPRRVSDSISTNEIPDLFRTIGFYPSDFELENIMIDVKFRHMDETNKINEDINFIEFVKLYCNHKPVYGYSEAKLEDAFNTLIAHLEGPDAHAIKRDKLLDILSQEGETMTHTNIFKCFKTLMRVEDADETFDFLPEEIDFGTLVEDILGIDMERDKVIEPPPSSSDESEDRKTDADDQNEKQDDDDDDDNADDDDDNAAGNNQE